MTAHTDALFEKAMRLSYAAKQKALPDGMKYISRSEATTIAAAEMTATATIFAALVEADLAEQIRSLKGQDDVG